MKYISCPYRTCFTLKKFFFFFFKYNQLAIEIVNSALSLLLVYLSILMPKPHLYYCSFVISFEICKCEFTIFVPFQNCVGYLGPLSIPYELEDEFLHFWEKKKTTRVLIRIVLTLWITLDSSVIFTVFQSVNASCVSVIYS